MASRVRLLLKAFAVARYLASNQRIAKITTNAKLFVSGSKSASELVKEVIPFYKQPLQKQLLYQKAQKKVGLYCVFLVGVGICSFEYYQHRNVVPITHRRHFAVIPRDFELKYQDSVIQSLRDQFCVKDGESTHSLILNSKDERVALVTSIVNRIKEACVYFSPECEYYMSKMEILVVDDDEVNAYTTMGSIIVVYTGLLNYFKDLEKKGKITNYEECIAGVLSHEMAHSLSRHPVESMLRWTSFAYYVYITLIPDLIIMPVIKGILDKRLSRDQEHEADFQALYLLKRSGYDPSSMITTLSLLPDAEEVDDMEIVSKTKEIVDDHPRIVNRVTYLQDKMFWFEKDFKLHYEVRDENSG
ncbi:hypothetical protein WA577_002668, partial [Blastocystis sp. JDR]